MIGMCLHIRDVCVCVFYSATGKMLHVDKEGHKTCSFARATVSLRCVSVFADVFHTTQCYINKMSGGLCLTKMVLNQELLDETKGPDLKGTLTSKVGRRMGLLCILKQIIYELFKPKWR